MHAVFVYAVRCRRHDRRRIEVAHASGNATRSRGRRGQQAMIVFTLPPNVLVVDTDAILTFDDCKGLVADGFKARGGYLGQVTAAELADQFRAGLPFFPICFAGDFNGTRAAARMIALGFPAKARVWWDIENIQET